jgi:phage baseplate assembly protein W
MNALCHVAQALTVWELRTKLMTRTARRTYAEVLLESLDKSVQEAAEAHAEIAARQKLWTSWRVER